jgi:hypothetical protein
MRNMDLPNPTVPRLLDAMDPVFITAVGSAPRPLEDVQLCTGGSGDSGDSGGEIGDTD